MKEKKSIEFSFGWFLLILVIIIAIVFCVARKTGNKTIGENLAGETEQTNKQNSEKLFSKNVITIDEGNLDENWETIDEEFGSVLFYIQGPKEENEDGTVNDIKINIYLQKSAMTNDELKTQMLEDSIYQEIEYTKTQKIDNIQWMEFEAKNKGIKAKIVAVMKDGYMYAAEICGEESKYDQYYNQAMKTVLTLKIAERIALEDAQNTIYKFDNIMNIKKGGTQYLVTSLNLPIDEELKEEDYTLPEEYADYKWTGIKYSDFDTEMKKYMTEDVIKKEFSEFINYKDLLFYKEVTGEQTDYMIEEVKMKSIKGNETTYEVIKSGMTLFQTLRQNVTVKNENNKLVISNIE